MVLEQITYFQIFGKPLIMYGGILTLLLTLFTASIAILNKKGINTIPFPWHQRMAIVTIIFALIHGTLGVLAYF
jgi:hypothetical protein